MHILALIPKKYYLYALIILIVGGLVIGMGIFTAFFDDEGEEETEYGTVFDPDGLNLGTLPLSALVEGYREDVEREAKANGIPQYTDLLLAKMQQESGGSGNDPMQSSESLCGYMGCIKSPQASITQGVKYFKEVMDKAGHDVLLGLQSYNYGSGFIGYAKEHNGGKYSKELAIKFSQMMYEKLAYTGLYSCIRGDSVPTGACYGDPLYVDAVLRYYHPKSVAALENVPVGGGNAVANAKGKLKAVLEEGYKYKGMAYVFGGNNPQQGFDCSSLMQWIFKEAGVNLPRTANEQYKASKKIQKSDLKPGDLVFFTNTYNAGVPVTHVGIYIGDGKIYDANGGGVGETELSNSYWKSHLYGYGRVADFNS
ncbi:bifunctional lytic transglycosylase/C40 family peptidase [Peribacillus butanolivorans]|uniref:bifunctional lytic transglycosylase/C40 family peptidase n=1 Tax=Peribacillus butanolivorans TaxID=421767 RepID=UPI003651ED21